MDLPGALEGGQCRRHGGVPPGLVDDPGNGRRRRFSRPVAGGSRRAAEGVDGRRVGIGQRRGGCFRIADRRLGPGQVGFDEAAGRGQAVFRADPGAQRAGQVAG